MPSNLFDVHHGRGTAVVLSGYDADDERRREALFSLGNGMLSVRCYAAESSSYHHYPGTYRAGCYNRLADIIEGERVENEALVNLPNWLPLAFRIQGEEDWSFLESVEILSYRQTLHLGNAVVARNVRFRDRRGRRTRLYEKRLVSMEQPHLAAFSWRLTAENWSSAIEIRSAIDGGVINGNVARFKPYDPQHLRVLDKSAQDQVALLRTRTRQSGIEIVTATRTYVEACDAVYRSADADANGIAIAILCELRQDQPLLIEKTAAIYTCRDPVISEPAEAALQSMRDAPRFKSLLSNHIRSFRKTWQECVIEADDEVLERTLRFHMLHLLQTISRHSVALDVGFPARGWQEAYHGQIFWDEILVFPGFNVRWPELSRALLLYRYRRLDEARRAARRHGYRGAMFPWRSASTGQEVTPTFQLNPLSGRFMRDHTDLQRHIGAAIAYNTWSYFLSTGDTAFMTEYGAELILEIARFWASIAQWQSASQRYEIRNVVGPDEYHTAAPGSEQPGIANNAYTNVMATWTLARAAELLEQLPARHRRRICDDLQIEASEPEHWRQISRNMLVPFHDDVISQFEGFGRLKELDFCRFQDQAHGRRIDWVLNAMDDSINAYQVVKQPDVLMLIYHFGAEELIDLLRQLGYQLTKADLERTARYYLRRTSHDSSISRIVCAGALAQLDPAQSWRLYRQALRPELNPANRVSSKEGLHLGAMAGTIEVLQRQYLGLKFELQGIKLDPALPAHLGHVKLPFQYHRDNFELETVGSRIILRASPENRCTTKLWARAHEHNLPPGGQFEFP